MSLDAWIANLFGSTERPPSDAEMSEAWAEYEEQHPAVLLACHDCGKLTREMRIRNGKCPPCNGFTLIQGGKS